MRGMNRREAIGVLAAGAAGFAFGAPPAFPKKSVVRTVLGDVSPDALASKATLFHEHLSFEWARVTGRQDRPGPAKDAGPIVEQLDVAAMQGVGCIVDAGTTDVGRDVAFLKQLASRTSIHIVACGGMYMQRTYPADVAARPERQIADELVRDAMANGYGALGEIGESPDAAMSADERKVFRAVGLAHRRTNLPVFTHNAYGTGPNVPKDAGLTQLSVLESAGVNPNRVAIGHTCCLDDPKADVIKAIARRGAYVGFDRVGGGLVPDDKKVTMLLAFLDAGYADRLLLSSDYNFTAKSAARPGYATTLTMFLPKLRAAGIKDETVHRIMFDNPRRFLAFIPK
jgi:predicted metal-dependent phosphotriesterase family hydrolase